MDKIKTFEKEYEYIKNEKYIDDLKKIINLLPDYFFEIPASSTGKYHPNYAGVKNGLVNHTKAAARIAYELLENNSLNQKFTESEKDLIIISLILHDGLKKGMIEEKYTRFDHPLLAADFIRENKDILSFSEEELNFICDNISSHMGEWNTNFYTKVVLPLPKTDSQKFVHMCDFLASRKFLEIEFEEGNIKY